MRLMLVFAIALVLAPAVFAGAPCCVVRSSGMGYATSDCVGDGLVTVETGTDCGGVSVLGGGSPGRWDLETGADGREYCVCRMGTAPINGINGAYPLAYLDGYRPEQGDPFFLGAGECWSDADCVSVLEPAPARGSCAQLKEKADRNDEPISNNFFDDPVNFVPSAGYSCTYRADSSAIYYCDRYSESSAGTCKRLSAYDFGDKSNLGAVIRLPCAAAAGKTVQAVRATCRCLAGSVISGVPVDWRVESNLNAQGKPDYLKTGGWVDELFAKRYGGTFSTGESSGWHQYSSKFIGLGSTDAGAESKADYFLRTVDNAVTPNALVTFDNSVRLTNAHLSMKNSDFCTCG